MRSWNRFGTLTLPAMALIAVVGCGSGNSTPPPPTASYAIGGAVLGLSGAGLVLQDNGGNNLRVSANASSYAFTFCGSIPTGGASYSNTELSDHAGQACTIGIPI